MLKKETVSVQLISILDKLMNLDILKGHRLVGGTALALQLGHRKSVDIDLFSSEKNNYVEIYSILKALFNQSIQQFRTHTNGISLVIDNVKIDIYDWDGKFLFPCILENMWRLTEIKDIIPMKLNTFCDSFNARYEKKDFIDISVLLDEYPIEVMIDLYKQRYPENLLSDRIILEHFSRIDRAENTEMPQMIFDLSWDNAKQKISNSIDAFIKKNLQD